MLRFTEGNPLTLLVVLRQALNEGLRDARGIIAFVERLRAGEQGFEDEASQRRDRSLAVSLEYGFARAFNEEEQRVLALLVFFQGFVDVRALQLMGVPDRDWSLPELRGRTKEQLVALLDRAAGLGLLDGLGGGYCRIHPALPWFFRPLFDRFYPEREAQSPPLPLGEGRGEGHASDAKAAARAFCAGMGALGDHYFWEYERGRREVIDALWAQEANLLQAWRLARRLGLWDPVTSTMQGLRQLYDHTGRRAEWRGLVAAVVPAFVGADDGPRPGREEQWGLVNDYRVHLAREGRDWAEAERLQRRKVELDRGRAAPWLGRPAEGLDDLGRHQLRTLAVSLSGLGNIQRSMENPECVTAYEENLALSQRIGDTPGVVVTAFNLGHVYYGVGGGVGGIPALRDLGQADRWYRRSLELRAEADRQGQGQCQAQLGAVAWERAEEAQVRAALGHYHKALGLLPADAVNDLSVTHNQLGMIYGDIGRLDDALRHNQASIRLKEESGDHYGAASTRFNVAIALLQAGRRQDALDYAHAALQGFQRYGERAQAEIDNTQALIREIQG